MELGPLRPLPKVFFALGVLVIGLNFMPIIEMEQIGFSTMLGGNIADEIMAFRYLDLAKAAILDGVFLFSTGAILQILLQIRDLKSAPKA